MRRRTRSGSAVVVALCSKTWCVPLVAGSPRFWAKLVPYVDKIGIQCRNGTNSAQYGGGGGADFQMESPLGFDQLDIGSGKYIDSIKGWSSGVTIGSAGGGGGAKNSYTCPGGKVMGLGVRSGTYVDSLRVLCGK